MTLTYPAAKLELIPPGGNDPRIQPVGAVLHVAATNAPDLRSYFDGPSGGIESHFYILKDGTVLQYRDLEHEADAQFKGNSWISGAHRNGMISIETQGLGPDEWTPAQLEAIKKLLSWLSKRFGFPLRKVTHPQPPSPSTGGVGYHALFPSWNTSAHSCPGPARIKQFNDALVPWMSNPQEDDVTKDDIAAIAAAVKAELLGPALRDQVRQALDAELGDESGAGAFSDRVAEKVAAKVVVKNQLIDPNTLAGAVADAFSARLKG